MAMGVYTLKTEVSLKKGRFCKIIFACISCNFVYLTTVCLYFQASIDGDQCSLRCASDFTEPSQLRCNGSSHGPAHSLCYPWLPVHCDKKGQLDIIDLCKTDHSLKLFLSPKYFTNLGSGCGSWYSSQGDRVPFKGFFTRGEGVPQGSL